MAHPPRPPLFERVPHAARTLLLWSPAVALGLLVFLALPAARGHLDLSAGNVGRSAWVDLAVCAVLAVPVGLLPRAPLTVLGVLIATFGLATALDANDVALLQFLAVDLAVGYVATCRTRRTSVPAAAAALLSLVGYWLTRSVVYGSPMGDTYKVWLLPVSLVAAWAVGVSVRQRGEYARALRAQTAAAAVAAERLLIARELHDVVAHNIGIIAIQAGAAGRVADRQPAAARDALATIETTSRDTLSGLRHLLVALRQADGRPAGGRPSAGLPPLRLDGLDALAASVADVGLDLEVERHGPPRSLTPDVELAAYRIVQEAVTNVVRHAGASRCRVRIDYRPAEVGIEVVDDGRGDGRGGGAGAGGARAVGGRGGPAGPGYGLVGMRERVALLHGRFEAGPGAAGGFVVRAALPG